MSKLLEWQERRLSRRGFLAKVGGVTAGIGLVMAGAAAMPRIAHATPCCPVPACAGCPGPPGCPGGCTVAGAPTLCCDANQVGSTNTLHQCLRCTNCGISDCYCEYDTGDPCP